MLHQETSGFLKQEGKISEQALFVLWARSYLTKPLLSSHSFASLWGNLKENKSIKEY